jgi:hypothetical protein
MYKKLKKMHISKVICAFVLHVVAYNYYGQLRKTYQKQICSGVYKCASASELTCSPSGVLLSESRVLLFLKYL